MTTTHLTNAVRHLAGTIPAPEPDADGALLEAFVATRDESAFAELVRRHGRMVLGVCLRLLGDRQHAEDAFQAVFLVLARRADAVRPRHRVGNWLYGVAYRTALQARAAHARRRFREMRLEHPPEPAVCDREAWLELQPVLDEELNRLPAKYRVPVVMCELEGVSRKDAARALGIPEGTLSSRLAAARRRLADRLSRRGVVLSAGGLSGLLAQTAASAAVPAGLVHSTVQAAAGAGIVPAPVAALATGVMKGMFLSKLKTVTGAVLALVLAGGGAGVVSQSTFADDKPREGAKPAGKRDGDKPAAPREGEKGAAKDGDKPREGARPKDGDRPAAGKGEKLTLTGKVSKEETKRKRDDGSEIAITLFVLTEDGGNKVQLPSPRGGDGERNTSTAANSPATFVGKSVTVSGTGVTAPVKEGSSTKRVVRLTAITEIKEKK